MTEFALISWPLISVLVFLNLGRERGLIWSVLLGYLLLPERYIISLSGLPDYSKATAISLGALLGLTMTLQRPSFPLNQYTSPTDLQYITKTIIDIWQDVLKQKKIDYDHSLDMLGASRDDLVLIKVRMKSSGIPNSILDELDFTSTVRSVASKIYGNNIQKPQLKSLTWLYFILFIVFVFGSLATIQTNREALIYGLNSSWGLEPTVIPALRFWDGVNRISNYTVAVIPFVLAYLFLRTPIHRRELMKAVVAMSAVYSLFALVEIRLGPQLHTWVYGYFQHSFIQHIRGGHFRPIVFLSHGITLGIFYFYAALFSLSLFLDSKHNKRYIYFLLALYFVAVLVVSRNTGALILGIVILPTLILVPHILARLIPVFSILFFVLYPILTWQQVSPARTFVDFIRNFAPERADSLAFRLEQEAALLERALEKPFFGWGGWGRWRVFDEHGIDRTVSDGIWAIMIGEGGVIGFGSIIGVYALALLFFSRTARREESSVIDLGLGLAMAANLLYMIPNATLDPLSWMIAGAVASYVRWYLVKADNIASMALLEQASESRYTRFPRRKRR